MADTVMSVQNKSLDRLSTVQAAATAQKAHVEALRRDVARAKVAAEKALKAATAARAQASAAKIRSTASRRSRPVRPLRSRRARPPSRRG